MTDLTINIDDYLGEEEKGQIARQEFRAACARRCATDFERILSNAAYELVQKEVDAAFDGNMADVVRTKAVEVINKLSDFTVFRRPDAWDRESSKGWTYLQEAIEAAKPVMAERVLAIIAELDGDDLRGRLDGLIGDVIVSKLTAPS